MQEEMPKNAHCILKLNIKESSFEKYIKYDVLNKELEGVINNFFQSKGIETELLSAYSFYPGSRYMPESVKCQKCKQWLLKNTGSSEGCVYEYAIEGSLGVYYCNHCYTE